MAIEIAKIPEQIRGFDLVKQRHVKSAKSNGNDLMEEFRQSVENPVSTKSVETVS